MKLRYLLLPFSLVYALVASLRNLLFNTGVFSTRKFELPIILVGNLSVGGSGKTPHVEYLVRLLRKKWHVATLSRGYGRRSRGFVIAGKGVDAEMIGDEPMQYYDKFTDITVAVCENRVNGVQRLIDSGRNPGVIIMDDGFQHRWIDPGMKLLLTPFDHLYTRDYVLPAGNLRERRTGYRRADCIIITKCDDRLTEDVKKKLVREIKPVNGQKVFFSFHTFNNPVSFFSKETLTVDQLKGKNILVFSGIANPTALFLYVKSLTTNYQVREFPDHHIYTEKDIRSLIGKFDKFAGQSVILTTEKDYQRIKGTSHFHLFDPLPCYFLPVTVRLEPSREFDEMILKYVEQHQRNRRLHQ